MGINARIASSAPSIGVTYHVTEAIALRPAITFERTSEEQTLAVEVPFPGIPSFSADVDIESTLLGIGVGGFYYLDVRDDVSPYLGMEVGYLRQEQDRPAVNLSGGVPGGLTPQVATVETTEDLLQVAGLLGAQYRPVDRFALFGEVGIGATFSEGTSDGDTDGETSGSRIGLLTSAVGIVLYLNR